MKILLYLVSIFTLASCGTNSLGYFEVQPLATSAAKFNEPLYIDFGPQVKNNFNMTQGGISTLNVKKFRESFRYALAHTFRSQFSSVKFYTGKEQGFVLRVEQLRSQWLIGREKRMINQAFSDTMRVQDFACFLRYSTSLYYNKKKLSDVQGEIREKPDYSKSWRIENLFQQTLRASCEDMARKISEKMEDRMLRSSL